MRASIIAWSVTPERSIALRIPRLAMILPKEWHTTRKQPNNPGPRWRNFSRQYLNKGRIGFVPCLGFGFEIKCCYQIKKGCTTAMRLSDFARASFFLMTAFLLL